MYTTYLFRARATEADFSVPRRRRRKIFRIRVDRSSSKGNSNPRAKRGKFLGMLIYFLNGNTNPEHSAGFLQDDKRLHLA